jgi:hypothetical protein
MQSNRSPYLPPRWFIRGAWVVRLRFGDLSSPFPRCVERPGRHQEQQPAKQPGWAPKHRVPDRIFLLPRAARIEPVTTSLSPYKASSAPPTQQRNSSSLRTEREGGPSRSQSGTIAPTSFAIPVAATRATNPVSRSSARSCRETANSSTPRVPPAAQFRLRAPNATHHTAAERPRPEVSVERTWTTLCARRHSTSTWPPFGAAEDLHARRYDP